MSMEQVETGSFTLNGLAPEAPELIRVVSWNIARGSRLKEITEFLAGLNVDLVLLQEADCNARRTGYRNIAAEIARDLRMNYAFGIEFQELCQGRNGSPAYHGQATMSRLPIADCRILRFCRQSGFWHPHWWIPRLSALQRRLGGRMALLSHILVGKRRLAVYNLHLESRSDELRRAQLAELLEDTRGYESDLPVILAGDFNLDLTESAAASAIENLHFSNPFHDQRAQTTRPGSFGRGTAIDWIVFREGLTSTAARVHHSVSASDHYPLFLRLKLF